MAKYSKTAEKLLPHLLQELSQVQPVIIAQAGGGGSLAEHDLAGDYHTGILDESQAPWAVTATTFAAHEADPDAHHAQATAGTGIIIAGQQVSLNPTVAGAGLTHASGVLSVGVSGLGLSVAADAVALASSSNPGVAASILATSAAGAVTLQGELQLLGADDSAQLHLRASTPGADSYIWQDGGNLRFDVESLAEAVIVGSTGIVAIANRLSTPLIVAAADMTISPAGDLTIDVGGGEIFIPGADTLRSSAWTSGVLGTGWGLQERGGAGRSHLDIRSIYCDELIATTFTADQVRVRSGSDWLGEALAIAARDNSDNKVTIPNIGGGAVRIYVEDAPEVTGQIFDANEYVLIKTINRSSGLVIRETWGQVSSYIDEANGRQSYSWTTVSGSGSFTLEPGTALTGFGVSSGSYIFRTVIEAGRGPFERFATWSTNPYTPANRVSRVEIGDIKNAAGDSTTRYGIAAGNNLALTPATGFSGFTADSVNGAKFYNGSLEIYSGGARDVWIAAHGMYVRTDNHGIIAFASDLSSGLNAQATEFGRLQASNVGGHNALIITAWDDAVSGRNAQLQLLAYGIGTGGLAQINLYAGDGVDSISLSADTVQINGNTVWHAGNDGPSSGLYAQYSATATDADTLDSYHASALAKLTTGNTFTELNIFAKAGAIPLAVRIDTSGLNKGIYVETTGALATSTNNDTFQIYHVANDVWAFQANDSGGYINFALSPSGGSVLIGTTSNTYSARLNVSGNIHSDAAITAENFFQLKQRSGSPGSATGFGRIYYDSGDDKLKYITSGGTVRTLSYT
jgi:hypothetical protein